MLIGLRRFLLIMTGVAGLPILGLGQPVWAGYTLSFGKHSERAADWHAIIRELLIGSGGASFVGETCCPAPASEVPPPFAPTLRQLLAANFGETAAEPAAAPLGWHAPPLLPVRSYRWVLPSLALVGRTCCLDSAPPAAPLASRLFRPPRISLVHSVSFVVS
jgi:hypothetical protein